MEPTELDQQAAAEATPRMDAQQCAAAQALSRRGLQVALQAPGYILQRFLGRGAYGEVWTAISRNTGRTVAIKFFTVRGGLDWTALAREVDKLRHLFSDRYVVQLFEIGWEADPPYYVMEYMENGSLEELLRTGPLPVAQAVSYFRDITVALIHAHDKGILHCDLKPANILLDQDWRPRLADFGQARLVQEASPALGTLFYMAPEQADLEAIPDARWDVYALGAVMYRMLTGELPHAREGPWHQNLPLAERLAAYRDYLRTALPPRRHRMVPGVDSGLAAIVERCLAVDPERRYANPQAVYSALESWQMQRLRRPLLMFTAGAFGLLMLFLALVGAYLFYTTITTAEREVIQRALEANRFAAAAEANQLALEIEHRWRILEFEAADPQLHQWLSDSHFAHNRDAQAALEQWLAERRAKYNRDFRSGSEASLWMALDAKGILRGAAPPSPYRLHYFGHRDYFTGLGRNLTEDTTGPPAAIITAPHRSLVYRRRSTRTWTVTFSVPVYGMPDDLEPLGVLAMSVDLKQESASAAASRFPVLVDCRPDEKEARPGLIVRHPYMTRLPPELPDEQLPLYYAESILAALGEHRSSRPLPNGQTSLPPEVVWLEHYTDPVDDPVYAGPWLAAAVPVLIQSDEEHPQDTGFVVLVQERRDEVLAPVRALQWRLGYGAAVALFVVLILLAAWTAGLTALLQQSPSSRLTRFFRRWLSGPVWSESLRSSSTGTLPGSASPALSPVEPSR
ncbi:MAG: protein kinase [Gemmataceae bacterium]|nr:protein kinase [Gemmataceae bacterium]MDW8242495.1 serine/threonine protein kinase [Thermogemmata sp.]